MPAKQRLTITIDTALVSAAQRAVDDGSADSISAWVNTAIADKVERDERLLSLASAIADFEAEYGEITQEEIAAQTRADRASATVVRRNAKSA